jgi:hypothetical protein
VILRIGPVPSAAALVWTTHLLHNLRVVRDGADMLPFRFPVEIADAFEELLRAWRWVALTNDVFSWEDKIETARVKLLLHYWVNLDSLTDAEVTRLGIWWAPPEARPFFVAVTSAVADALQQEEDGGSRHADLLMVHGRREVRV